MAQLTHTPVMTVLQSLEQMSQTKEERLRALARERAVWDYNTDIITAREEGLEEGIQKGREEGREEGRQEGRQITGKKTQVGNNVSHANNKTKRKFYPNLKTKRFFLESEGVWVQLKVSTQAMRTINKKGLEATLISAAKKGTLSL